MFYEDVFRKLGERNVKYAVAGGVALVLHGVVRFTADLDLIVDLGQESLKRFVQAMASRPTDRPLWSGCWRRATRTPAASSSSETRGSCWWRPCCRRSVRTRRVNQVTPELFARWPTPQALAAASQGEVEEVIRPTGFFRTKARSLRAAARLLVSDHGGTIPADLDRLVQLPGVGRKTAKVVLGEGLGTAAGVTVDTHGRRVTRRLGLTRRDDPEQIATELEELVSQDEWIKLSMRLILHGRLYFQ